MYAKPLVVWIAINFLFLGLVSANINPLDKKDGLKGNVKSVIEESYEIETKNAKRIANRMTGKRVYTFLYDSNGALIEKVCKFYSGYDLKNNISNSDLFTNEKVIYSYANGRLSEETVFHDDLFKSDDYKDLKSKTIYHYDLQGNVKKINYYNEHGARISSVRYSYFLDRRLKRADTQTAANIYEYLSDGRIKEENIWYKAKSRNLIFQKQIKLYDSHGNTHEDILLVPKEDYTGFGIYEIIDGFVTIKSIYKYEEFDSVGNWTKRIKFEWVRKFGKSYREPESITYRTINYYNEKFHR